MNFIYEINEKNLFDFDGNSYVGYGVDCFEIFGDDRQLSGQICDLSVDLKIISEFVDRLNKFGVSKTHFYDIAYDFICEE